MADTRQPSNVLPRSQTLLEALELRFRDSSKSTIRKMLRSDRVRVNGTPERDAKRPIAAGDRVEIAAKSERLDSRIRILFDDADLIVVDKAEGLLSVPSAEVLHESVETFLNEYLGGRDGDTRIHHVHRLDRDASGVLAFAKNAYVRDRLQERFAAHDIDRVYVAIVHGRLREAAGTFRSFVAEDANLRVRSVAGAVQGKEAITHYRTTAAGERYSILEVTLETGRRNQIRVHLAEAGHPVVGDRMYGGRSDDELGRLGLHAIHLGFVHPRSGRNVAFTADVPLSFRELRL